MAMSLDAKPEFEIAGALAAEIQAANPTARVEHEQCEIAIKTETACVTLTVGRFPDKNKPLSVRLRAVPPFMGAPNFQERIRETYQTHGYANMHDQWHRLLFDLADRYSLNKLAASLALHGVELPAPDPDDGSPFASLAQSEPA